MPRPILLMTESSNYFRADFINSCIRKWEETGASGEKQVSKRTKYLGLHEQVRVEDTGRGLRSYVCPAIQRH